MTENLRPITYLKRPLTVQTEGIVQYLFTADFCSLPLYFALKGKHDYSLVNEPDLVEDIRSKLLSVAANYDLVLYPESRFPFLNKLLSDLPNATKMKKRSKAEICAQAALTPGWKKQDKESAAKAWSSMGDTFTINKVKANQRKYYVPYLFESISVPTTTRILLVDDFIMSGRTIDAMKAAIGGNPCDVFGVFYQQNFLR